MDVSEYSRQELDRLQLGWLVRERPGDERGSGHSSHKKDLQRGQQKARQEMFEDVGVA